VRRKPLDLALEVGDLLVGQRLTLAEIAFLVAVGSAAGFLGRATLPGSSLRSAFRIWLSARCNSSSDPVIGGLTPGGPRRSQSLSSAGGAIERCGGGARRRLERLGGFAPARNRRLRSTARLQGPRSRARRA
jgi:hypothetical protein